MATRYRVARQTVRFCKQTYHVGELLPESFSERDMYRVLYPSRIEKVEVPDEVETAASKIAEPAQEAAVEASKAPIQAAKTLAAPTKTTGTSISGKPVSKK